MKYLEQLDRLWLKSHSGDSKGFDLDIPRLLNAMLRGQTPNRPDEVVPTLGIDETAGLQRLLSSARVSESLTSLFLHTWSKALNPELSQHPNNLPETSVRAMSTRVYLKQQSGYPSIGESRIVHDTRHLLLDTLASNSIQDIKRIFRQLPAGTILLSNPERPSRCYIGRSIIGDDESLQDESAEERAK